MVTRVLRLLPLALVALPLCAQVPVEIASAPDTSANAFVAAMKEAVLGSGSFILKTAADNSQRLKVSLVVGGRVTCSEGNQFRGVALLISLTPHPAPSRDIVAASVYMVGEEAESARALLLRLHQAAEALGVR